MTATGTGVEVTMPQLGETVTEGTVTQWLKAVGDPVAVGEPLLEISTDKVDSEVPAPVAGTLLAILVPVDATVPVGVALAVIDSAESAAPVAPAESVAAPAAPVVPAAPVIPAPVRPHGPRHRHSPRVRRQARERGLDPDRITGTGPGGRVTPADLDRADRPLTVAPSASPAPIGMAAVEIDVTDLLDGGDVDRPALLALIAAAAVTALRRAGHPVTELTFAAGSGERLVRDAHDLSVDALRRRLVEPADVAAGAPLRVVDADPLSLQILPTRPGELAVLAVGAISDRVGVDRTGGRLGLLARSTVTVSVSGDPASFDAAALLAEVRRGLLR